MPELCIKQWTVIEFLALEGCISIKILRHRKAIWWGWLNGYGKMSSSCFATHKAGKGKMNVLDEQNQDDQFWWYTRRKNLTPWNCTFPIQFQFGVYKTSDCSWNWKVNIFSWCRMKVAEYDWIRSKPVNLFADGMKKKERKKCLYLI